jgi:hypothetical protein
MVSINKRTSILEIRRIINILVKEYKTPLLLGDILKIMADRMGKKTKGATKAMSFDSLTI